MTARPPGIDRVVSDLQRMARILNGRISNLAVLLGLIKVYSDTIAWTVTAAVNTTGTYNFPAGTFSVQPYVFMQVRGSAGGVSRATARITALSSTSFTWIVELNASTTTSGNLDILAVVTQ